ncbi:DUF4097 domain-containing protein [Shewanella sp. Scap07]|uniref:DUF4097 family beta strand repeat-containing protein n=1 Tax=Shewanella sp. Scap07 TaxID=2589987 RepID=UPI0015BCAF73|nr:DUF4097 family beta strand repeat-containing protein [Shewanella sp. Scap07]QLE86487.1 DUF4097 domain-containing protein [Shewanella sp. Scap07]
MKLGLHIGRLMLPLVLLTAPSYAVESIDKTIDVKPDLKLNITVQRGAVSISSWDKQSISIKGTLDELSEGFIIEQDGNVVSLEDKLPRRYQGSNNKGSQLTFMVPSHLTLNVDGVSSDYDVKQLNGKIAIDTVSGDIVANALQQDVILQTVSGDISSQSLAGNLQLETVSGNIKDNDSSGKARFTLVSGDLTTRSSASMVQADLVSGSGKLKLASVESMDLKTVSGDIDVAATELKDKASLDSVSGDITLSLPSDTNARFQIDGGPSGDINNKLSNDKPMKAKYTRSESLQFQLGNGQADIRISTISGDIDLK